MTYVYWTVWMVIFTCGRNTFRFALLWPSCGWPGVKQQVSLHPFVNRSLASAFSAFPVHLMSPCEAQFPFAALMLRQNCSSLVAITGRSVFTTSIIARREFYTPPSGLSLLLAAVFVLFFVLPLNSESAPRAGWDFACVIVFPHVMLYVNVII